MITETEISNILSGSLLGDFSPAIDAAEINMAAITLLRSILDIDMNGIVNSDLFSLNMNLNPRAVYDSQKSKLDECITNVTNLKDYGLPDAVKKLPRILDPDIVPNLDPGVREALIAERERLQTLFKSLANIPVVFSTTITD